MNEFERAICARVKELRERIFWPQTVLAERLGITVDQLISIEHGRTPLRYEIAWRIREYFGVRLEWMVEDVGNPDDADINAWPLPGTLKKSRILLSEVWDDLENQNPAVEVSEDVLRSGEDRGSDAQHRAYHVTLLHHSIIQAVANVPSGKVPDFSRRVWGMLEEALKDFEPAKSEDVLSRMDSITWEQIRMDAAKRFLRTEWKKHDLTETSEFRNTSGEMKFTLKRLLNEVRKLTEPTGMKAQLAAHLKVPQARVSEWLSEKHDPSGEMALKILDWVQNPELHKPKKS